ncbi:hypothetical protein EON62_01410 [archaeon]|nr:MAG: hypothetical protein EON62_01410 [archaeon]
MRSLCACFRARAAARQLKAEDLNGTSDPVAYVEVGGQKQHTATHEDATSCVFDHQMFFNFPKVSRAEVEALTVTLSIFDANKLLKNELIGSFTFDALDVYYQPNHCYYQRWVALVDPYDEDDSGVQGYCRMSVSVLGPGDKPYIPNELKGTHPGSVRARAHARICTHTTVPTSPLLCSALLLAGVCACRQGRP